ncbi:MAG: type I-C CRISPR-associated protein Cas5 [Phycisphaeraceae bacterium]|nr:type I-C CRISPR-associated protein Cas5 [Phycisphaeraceae bacterium]
MSFGIKLRVWGEYACFTRPEMKAERVSYDVMTPSAARGVVEAIYWKPQIRWVIDRIHVLKPIRFMNLRRNEVGSVIPAGTVETAMKRGTGALGVYVEEDRQQRAATILRDVEYVIEAHFEVLDPRDSDGGTLTPVQAEAKHLDQFNRRARQGQCFHRPYLGCREFACQFELVEGEIPASERAGSPKGARDLGYMLHDIDFRSGMTARFFRAQMKDGVIEVPHPESLEVRS